MIKNCDSIPSLETRQVCVSGVDHKSEALSVMFVTFYQPIT